MTKSDDPAARVVGAECLAGVRGVPTDTIMEYRERLVEALGPTAPTEARDALWEEAAAKLEALGQEALRVGRATLFFCSRRLAALKSSI